jgi:hypothetical protein
MYLYLYLTGEWRKIHTEEIYNLHSSVNIITAIQLRRMSWAGDVTRMRKVGRGYILLGEFDGNGLFGKPRNV